MPSLGMITINALVAADNVLIPVEAAYLPVKGLQQLIKTIGRVHRKLNPALSIMGILLTKVDRRTNFARDISIQIREEMCIRDSPYTQDKTMRLKISPFPPEISLDVYKRQAVHNKP